MLWLAIGQTMSSTETLLEQPVILSEDAVQRILHAAERERGEWVQVLIAVILSLATTASAWCAYQSKLWGDVQTFQIAGATRAALAASAESLEANQILMLDSSLFVQYIAAKSQGDERLADFFLQRFRPEMRKALDAWLATRPFENADAPLHPFELAEFVIAERREADRQRTISEQLHLAAQRSDGISDTYLLLTVLLASVLFFAGMATSFSARNVRWALTAIAIAMFVGTMIALATMPVCHG